MSSISECNHKNKFDFSIKQKLNENKLSRPIVKSDGRFDNPFPTWKAFNLLILAKWFSESNQSNIPKNKDELDKELPILKPQFSVENDKNNSFRVTWIGHATLVVQINKLSILTDPIFSERASPVSFFGPKRYRPPACDIESLPPIDYVIVSHNHYDHFDINSAKEINSRFGVNCRWIVPLGMGALLKSISIENFVELDWWQKDCSCRHPALKKDNEKQINMNKFAIYATPNQHWCRRSPFDFNQCLWASYTLISESGKSFFFGGDTGYCNAFKEIGDMFGPFQGAAIPIGAYCPRAMMFPAHVNPEEAIKIHQDLKSLKSIGIHHATFALGKEFYKEPANLIKKLIKEDPQNKPFITVKHGESVIC